MGSFDTGVMSSQKSWSGTPRFSSTFVEQGSFGSDGRTLRKLKLNGRLFQYTLSYLVYSDQFNTLPPDMLEYVYRRLWEILKGVEADEKYSHLDENTRKAIVDILGETKTGLPDYWH